MRFTLAEQNGVPDNVQIASALVQILAWFGVIFGVPACIAGVLSPVAFFLGLVLVAMAAVFFPALEGLRKRRRWASRLVIALSSSLALALVAVMVHDSMSGQAETVGLVIASIPLAMFASITWLLSTRSARAWFSVKKSQIPGGLLGTGILDE
jgi:hypothetical protein